MAVDFPYMTSTKNLRAILDKIKGAGTPPKFTQDFLKANLGFTSSVDRSVLSVLKRLGFLSPDGIPTPRYNEFRDGTRSAAVLAQGLKEGWSDVFLSDQAAPQRSAGELKELFKNISGKGESAAEKMASTFKVLADAADWSASPDTATGPSETLEEVDEVVLAREESARRGVVSLHHDVHVHLPTSSDVSVYTAIFRAMRQEILD